MSPIAKLFIVLNVVLAGAFLGFAARALSTETDFKKQLDETKTKLASTEASLNSDKSKLVAEKAELEKARDAMQGERDGARAEIDRLKGQITDQDRANNELRGNVAQISKSIDQLVADNKQLNDSRDKAAQAQRDAEKARDAAVAAQAAAEGKAGELETNLHAAEGKIADLEKSGTSMKKEVDSLNTQLASLIDATGAKLDDFANMPLIEGRVLDVAAGVEPGLIAINKGSADGVKRGFTFEFYEGKTYKGQGRAEYVHEHSTSVLLTRPVAGQKVRQGDSAATRL